VWGEEKISTPMRQYPTDFECETPASKQRNHKKKVWDHQAFVSPELQGQYWEQQDDMSQAAPALYCLEQLFQEPDYMICQWYKLHEELV